MAQNRRERERETDAAIEPSWDLASLVGALRQARHGHSEQRDPMTRRERPSRDAVVQIVRGLRAALFPTHYGVSDFTEASIDFFVGTTLDANLRALEEQVRRCLRYTTPSDEVSGGAIAVRSRALVRRFAERLPAVRAMLERDIEAACEADPAATGRAEVLLCYPGITAITHHRLAHELYRLEVPMLPRLVAEIAHASTGIDIHPGAQIGERFFIDHGTGVVIGQTAVIGDRVRLYQGVTLGARIIPSRDAEPATRHPLIEDDVVIYAGATVLGRITIGHGSVIGGNVWLTHDVPPGSHVTQATTRERELAREGTRLET
jgi:serine O-acetyltransferase